MAAPLPAKIAAGAAFCGLAVAWMMPPTTPKAPATTASRFAGAPKPVRDLSLDLRHLASVPEPVPMFVPPARRIAAEHVEPPEADGRSDAEADVDSTPIQHEDRRSSPPQRFREGYAWAEEVDVQDYRECRRWDGDSGRDGCLAYVEDQGDDRRIAYQRLDDRAGDVEPRGY